MALNSVGHDSVQFLNALCLHKELEILLPKDLVLFKFTASPIVQMHDTPFDSTVVSEISVHLLQLFLLLVFDPFKTLFVFDRVEEERDLGIFPLHLVLRVSPHLDDVLHLLLGEDALL